MLRHQGRRTWLDHDVGLACIQHSAGAHDIVIDGPELATAGGVAKRGHAGSLAMFATKHTMATLAANLLIVITIGR
jgi:hypothetical protein